MKNKKLKFIIVSIFFRLISGVVFVLISMGAYEITKHEKFSISIGMIALCSIWYVIYVLEKRQKAKAKQIKK